MNFKITSAWGVVSAIATLILAYLFLTNSEAAVRMFGSIASSANSTIGVLQGRTAQVSRVR